MENIGGFELVVLRLSRNIREGGTLSNFTFK